MDSKERKNIFHKESDNNNRFKKLSQSIKADPFGPLTIKAKKFRDNLPQFLVGKKGKELKKSQNQLELLHRISSAVSLTLNLDSLFKTILKQVTDHLYYDRALIMLVDRKRRVLHHGKIRGASAKIRNSLEGLEIPLDLQYQVFETVIRKNKPFVANPEDISNFIGFEKELVDFLKTKALAVLPLLVKKRLVGILWVDFTKRKHSFEKGDLHFLDQIASQIAIAVDNAQAYQTITQLNESLEAKVQERTRDLERTGLKLKEAFKALKELDNFKNRFFTNISHELRTPLTLLLGPLELVLESNQLGGKEKQILMTVKDNAKQLLKMINTLLDLTKIRAGKMHLRFQRTNVGTFLYNICERVKPSAEAKQIELRYKKWDDQFLFVDPDQFTIILQNLFTNALKFTDRGGFVQVTLKTENDNVIIEVRDSGIGIATSDLPHIFERFTQAESARTLGTGIGLSLAHEITELHNGKLEARSVVGAGTVLTLTLKKGYEHLRPEWVVEHLEESQAETKKKDLLEFPLSELTWVESTFSIDNGFGDDIENSQLGWRILVVEDQTDMRSYLKYILSKRYEVFTASHGREGFEKAKKEQPDLVVTDVAMADMDGYVLCDALRKDPQTSHLPIIFLTAHVDPDAVVRALESHGADDYVTKPFHARELLARVQRLLRLRELQAQLLQADKLAALGQLSAGLAHEINNPLGFLKAGLHNLRQKLSSSTPENPSHLDVGGNDQLDWVINSMEEGIERIRALVKGLQDYSRKDVNRVQQFSLKNELDLCLRILDPKIREKNISLSINVDEVPYIFSKGSQLGQVLMNLIHNAIQAVEHDGKISVTAHRRKQPSGSIEIQVKDDGKGILPEHLKRIFNPFFTTKDPGKGLGLGLSICDQIVRSHGGKIWVESKPHKGSCFHVILPQLIHHKSPNSLISLTNSSPI